MIRGSLHSNAQLYGVTADAKDKRYSIEGGMRVVARGVTTAGKGRRSGGGCSVVSEIEIQIEGEKGNCLRRRGLSAEEGCPRKEGAWQPYSAMNTVADLGTVSSASEQGCGCIKKTPAEVGCQVFLGFRYAIGG